MKTRHNSKHSTGAAMSIAWGTGIAALILTFSTAWGGTPATSAETENRQADSRMTATATLGECLEVDVHKSYSGKLFGHKGDDHYPMYGKKITRVDFQASVKGHAAAHITKQDSTEVVVHYWYDAFSTASYTLKVWVEC